MTELTENERISEKTAVALGLFDGVHHGHRRVVSRAVKLSERGLAPAVFTFRTESVKFKHGRPMEYIFPNSVKLELLEECGIRYVYSPDFDEVKEMSGEDFVREILLKKMNAGIVICGDDFRFGKNAGCGVRELKEFAAEYGFEAETVRLDGFSSEKYRELLREGKAEELLASGDPYKISAEVVRGNKIGRTLNFPTINQQFAPGQLVPKHGVYATTVLINGNIYRSVTNIGVKPTVEKNIQPLAETHILDFSGDLYGSFVDVGFCGFIRGEKKFASLEGLKNQISADIAYVREQCKNAETSGKD